MMWIVQTVWFFWYRTVKTPKALNLVLKKAGMCKSNVCQDSIPIRFFFVHAYVPPSKLAHAYQVTHLHKLQIVFLFYQLEFISSLGLTFFVNFMFQTMFKPSTYSLWDYDNKLFSELVILLIVKLFFSHLLTPFLVEYFLHQLPYFVGPLAQLA